MTSTMNDLVYERQLPCGGSVEVRKETKKRSCVSYKFTFCVSHSSSRIGVIERISLLSEANGFNIMQGKCDVKGGVGSGHFLFESKYCNAYCTPSFKFMKGKFTKNKGTLSSSASKSLSGSASKSFSGSATKSTSSLMNQSALSDGSLNQSANSVDHASGSSATSGDSSSANSCGSFSSSSASSGGGASSASTTASKRNTSCSNPKWDWVLDVFAEGGVDMAADILRPQVDTDLIAVHRMRIVDDARNLFQIEIRALNQAGLLGHVCSLISDAGFDIRSGNFSDCRKSPMIVFGFILKWVRRAAPVGLRRYSMKLGDGMEQLASTETATTIAPINSGAIHMDSSEPSEESFERNKTPTEQAQRFTVSPTGTQQNEQCGGSLPSKINNNDHEEFSLQESQLCDSKLRDEIRYIIRGASSTSTFHKPYSNVRSIQNSQSTARDTVNVVRNSINEADDCTPRRQSELEDILSERDDRISYALSEAHSPCVMASRDVNELAAAELYRSLDFSTNPDISIRSMNNNLSCLSLSPFGRNTHDESLPSPPQRSRLTHQQVRINGHESVISIGSNASIPVDALKRVEAVYEDWRDVVFPEETERQQIFPKGDAYELVEFENGDSYCGEMDQGTGFRHGVGEYLYNNTSTQRKYEGQWQQNKKHGQGIMFWKDGDCFAGQWQDNERHGVGVHVSSAGSGATPGHQSLPSIKYEGQWFAGEKHGLGIEDSMHHMYIGAFEYGRKMGLGVEHVAGKGFFLCQRESSDSKAMRVPIDKSSKIGDIFLHLGFDCEALAHAGMDEFLPPLYLLETLDLPVGTTLQRYMFQKCVRAMAEHERDQRNMQAMTHYGANVSKELAASGAPAGMTEAETIPSKKITRGKLISKGGFGAVYKGTLKSSELQQTKSGAYNIAVNSGLIGGKRISDVQDPLVTVNDFPTCLAGVWALIQNTVTAWSSSGVKKTERTSQRHGSNASHDCSSVRSGGESFRKSDFQKTDLARASSVVFGISTPDGPRLSKSRIETPEIPSIVASPDTDVALKQMITCWRKKPDSSDERCMIRRNASVEDLLYEVHSKAETEPEIFPKRRSSSKSIRSDESRANMDIATKLSETAKMSETTSIACSHEHLSFTGESFSNEGDTSIETEMCNEDAERQALRLRIEFKKEVTVLRTLSHPNIVKFLGVWSSRASNSEDGHEVVGNTENDSDPADPCIVLEYLPHSLFEMLHRRSMVTLNQLLNPCGMECNSGLLSHLNYRHSNDAHVHFAMDRLASLKISQQICQGIGYLHRLGIVHADLKSPNVLATCVLDPDTQEMRLVAKLCDFGHSAIRKNPRMHEKLGTPHWAAPEALRGEGIGFPADVYSFGVILWEMVHSTIPFKGYSFGSVIVACGWARRVPSVSPKLLKKYGFPLVVHDDEEVVQRASGRRRGSCGTNSDRNLDGLVVTTKRARDSQQTNAPAGSGVTSRNDRRHSQQASSSSDKLKIVFKKPTAILIRLIRKTVRFDMFKRSTIVEVNTYLQDHLNIMAKNPPGCFDGFS